MGLMDKIRNIQDPQEVSTPTLNLGTVTLDDTYQVVPNVVDKFKRYFGGRIPKWLDAVILKQIQEVDNDEAAKVVEQCREILEDVLAEYRKSRMMLIEGGAANGESD